ncbi:uncharacterized protein LOC135395313 [Ornithodoros turicata]|uniref:uncharacterized protein LOC135395313 n=1 Tax=Ornithodoros turicata TaxID=34597 RepID=UPI0031389CA9
MSFSRRPLFGPAWMSGDTGVNSGVIPVTLPSSYFKACTNAQLAPPTTQKIPAICPASIDDDDTDEESLEHPPAVTEVSLPHHDDDDATFLRPWYTDDGDFENKNEDLSIMSSVAPLWSLQKKGRRQEPAKVPHEHDVTALMGELGLQVTSLATPKPLPVSSPRPRAVFSAVRGIQLCKGIRPVTAVAGTAPESGDHSNVQGDHERGVRPQESGDNVSGDVRFDSEPTTPQRSEVAVARPKGIHKQEQDVTRRKSLDEATFAPSDELPQARTAPYSKLTGDRGDSDEVLSPVGDIKSMSSPQRTKMTMNQMSPLRLSPPTRKNYQARGVKSTLMPSATAHTRTASSRLASRKTYGISTSFKKFPEPDEDSRHPESDRKILGRFLSSGSTSDFPTIDSFHPHYTRSDELENDISPAGVFANGGNDLRKTTGASASGDTMAHGEKSEHISSTTGCPVTAGSLKRDGLKTPPNNSGVKNKVGSFSDFFSGVILDPHFTSTPVTIHNDLESALGEEQLSWQGFDVFPSSEYFKAFESFPQPTGTEERSMSMSGDVYESLSTGFPPSRLVGRASPTAFQDSENASSRALPPRECVSSVDSFFTVASFDEDSLSTVLCNSPARNRVSECPATDCSPSSKSNWTFYSASTTDSRPGSQELSPSISQQDLIDISLFNSTTKNETTSSVPKIGSGYQTSSMVTTSYTSTEADEPSIPPGFVDGSGGSDAVGLLPGPEDSSTASQGSNREGSQVSKQNEEYWGSFQSHPRLLDESSEPSSCGSPSRWSDSEEWKMFLSSAESSTSPSNLSGFQSYEEEHVSRAMRNVMLPRYLKLSSTTEMFAPFDHRPLRLPDDDSIVTSDSLRLVRGSKSVTSDTTVTRSEASQSVLERPSATSISMPDLNNFHAREKGEESYIMDMAYTTCMPVADNDPSVWSTESNGCTELNLSPESSLSAIMEIYSRDSGATK